MRIKLRTIRWEAEGINSFILEPLEGETLPEFTPGAHIDVQLAPGLARSYSLVNDPQFRDHYEIAVHDAPAGRGGSRHIHTHWQVGQHIEISAPKNNFPLHENAPHSTLIAGGIGITPMLPMIARLNHLGKSWSLFYVAATPQRAAYAAKLKNLGDVTIVYDGIPGGRRLDLAQIIADAPPDAHLYCCGPAGMLEAFVKCCAARPADHVHIEYFSAQTELATAGGYSLELAKSGKSIQVAEGETMLDALLGAGVDIGFACSEGICGTCRVEVLDGVPDHRDHFLTESEKAANQAVMVCCSGARTPKLVLNL